MESLQLNPSAPINKNIPIELLIDYSSKGLSYSEIGKLAGCNSSNVYHRFKAAGYVPEHLKAYKDNRADVFSWWQSKILNSINEDDIKRAPLQSKVVAAGILYDKERLERGQAGQILGFDALPDNGLSQAITGLLAKAERIGLRITDIVGELPSKAKEVLHQNLDGDGRDLLDCVKP